MAVEAGEHSRESGGESHDRISHMDLLNLWRGDMQSLRADMDRRFSEMRWLIGIGFGAIALLIAASTFLR